VWLVVTVSELPVCVVAVWSAVNVAGTRLQDLEPKLGTVDDPENWEQVHCDVIERCTSLRFSVRNRTTTTTTV